MNHINDLPYHYIFSEPYLSDISRTTPTFFSFILAWCIVHPFTIHVPIFNVGFLYVENTVLDLAFI